jgi:hypothetical protein
VKSESDVFDDIKLGGHFYSGSRLIELNFDLMDLISCISAIRG